MVQLPEPCDVKSEAYKAGYKNICEIGKERIRRAGAKINAELEMRNAELNKNTDNNSELRISHSELDVGFRVLKLDTSNMKDVYYNPSYVMQESFNDVMEKSVENIKEDRTSEDLLFQVMLDLGILLSSKIEEKTIAEKKVFDVADGFLIACFDKDITEETITIIAKQQPYYFVMRNNGYANDCVPTNFEQIFATYSPNTTRKVL